MNIETYTSDSSDSDSRDLKTLNYSRQGMPVEYIEDTFLNMYKTEKGCSVIETILLNQNVLTSTPLSLCRFINLQTLDLSANKLTSLPDILFQMSPLKTLIVKNNLLTNDSLPKNIISKNGVLRELNLSGNLFSHFPEQLLELKGLKYLYLGGNKIASIPKDIGKLQR